MKLLFSIIVLFSLTLSAQEKEEPVKSERRQELLTTHSQMITAHQQAVECLNTSKSISECQKAFQQANEKAGFPRCMGMMRKRRDK